MSTIGRIAGLAAIIVLSSATGALADSPGAVSLGKTYYVGAGAGIVVPNDLNISFSGTLSGAGHYSFDVGQAYSVTGGMHINKWFTGETELSYTTFGIKSLGGTINSLGRGSFSVSGSLDAVLGFANALATPMGNDGPFSPYVGAGVGFASSTAKVNSISTITVNSSSSETDAALQFIVGADVRIDPHWSAGARYRFVWINNESDYTSGGTSIHESDLTAHALQLELRASF